jgi:lysylphosphatidylglycerol synthetase-like protein (DUF2156 family)
MGKLNGRRAGTRADASTTSTTSTTTSAAPRSFERTVAVRVLVILAFAAAIYGWRHNHHLGLALGMLIAARAISLGRPLTIGRYLASGALLFIGFLAAYNNHQSMTAEAEIAAGAVVALPRRAPGPGTDAERMRVRGLVDATSGDTLAPFALRTDKSYVFSPDLTAAVAYKVRFGTAVASGDPVGNAEAREAAIDAFLAETERNGWRPTVLGAGEEIAEVWRNRGMKGLCIGREVVLDVPTFSMDGRHNRNVRQAVSRATNAGVTTAIVAERSLDVDTRNALMAVAKGAHRGGGSERGFSMILDHLLDGTHSNTTIAYARDSGGRLIGFQRYAVADGGRDISLDVPYRVPDAPNGTDERLIADVMAWAKERNASRVSLAFAAFPELFANTDRGFGQKMAFRAVHELDRFIRLESLYRFLRKYNAFGQGRYVMLRPSQVLFVLVSALTLEFGTRSPSPKVEIGCEAPETGAAPREAR